MATIITRSNVIAFIERSIENHIESVLSTNHEREQGQSGDHIWRPYTGAKKGKEIMLLADNSGNDNNNNDNDGRDDDDNYNDDDDANDKKNVMRHDINVIDLCVIYIYIYIYICINYSKSALLRFLP